MWFVIGAGVIALLFIFFSKAAGTEYTGVPFPGLLPMKKPRTLNELIVEKSNEFKIPAALIKAIIKQESNFNINAKNPSDPSYGLMQIMPSVAYDAGLIPSPDKNDLTADDISKMMNVESNLYAGCKLLKSLLSRHDLPIAVEMYNVGETGYRDKGYRNGVYRTSVMAYYDYYLENPNG